MSVSVRCCIRVARTPSLEQLDRGPGGIREARLGADHLDTAASLSNVAIVLADQGDLDGARRLQERALQIREARPGADHPTTMQSRQSLADILAKLENPRNQ